METQPTRDLFDFLTAGTAILGVALGLFNLWLHLDKRRVKLRVRPIAAMIASDAGGNLRFWHRQKELPDGYGFGLEIVNLSAFPVTVNEAGYVVRGKKGKVLIKPPSGEDQWPLKLEPREVVHAYLRPEHREDRGVGRAYATTACGVTRYGGGPVLRAFRKKQRKK